MDAADIVPFRYLVPLTYPIYATLRPFLARAGHTEEEVERMHQAWLKSVLLQVTLLEPPLSEGRRLLSYPPPL